MIIQGTCTLANLRYFEDSSIYSLFSHIIYLYIRAGALVKQGLSTVVKRKMVRMGPGQTGRHAQQLVEVGQLSE